jgi:hypothetical protein
MTDGDSELPGGLLFESMLGGSLEEQNCVLSPEQKSFAIRDVVTAIDALHANGIVHGNVKPRNILLESGACHAKLSDCALEPRRHISRSTRQFAAPEIISGEGATFESDIWSLANILYFVVTGRFASNFGHRKLNSGVASGRIPGIPGEVNSLVADLIRAGMSRDPKDRPNAKAIKDMLAGINWTLYGEGSRSLTTVAQPANVPGAKIEIEGGRVRFFREAEASCEVTAICRHLSHCIDDAIIRELLCDDVARFSTRSTVSDMAIADVSVKPLVAAVLCRARGIADHILGKSGSTANVSAAKAAVLNNHPLLFRHAVQPTPDAHSEEVGEFDALMVSLWFCFTIMKCCCRGNCFFVASRPIPGNARQPMVVYSVRRHA